jgi:hypothetical protein
MHVMEEVLVRLKQTKKSTGRHRHRGLGVARVVLRRLPAMVMNSGSSCWWWGEKRWWTGQRVVAAEEGGSIGGATACCCRERRKGL